MYQNNKVPLLPPTVDKYFSVVVLTGLPAHKCCL